MVDVIAIPRLTLFFGIRLLDCAACAAAKTEREKSKRADNFQAGEYVPHMLLVPQARAGIHGAGSLSEGTELRFSNHGEKTCEMLGVVVVCDLYRTGLTFI